MSWTREQVSRLIDLYEANLILYMPTHPAYYNKAARNDVLEKISKQLEKIRPNTTAEAIKAKINTLRSQFNKEKSNLRKSIQNGTPTDEVFKPSLWCFDKLLFLQDAPPARPPWSKIKQDGVKEEEYIANEIEIQELHKVDIEEVEVYPDPLANTGTSFSNSATTFTSIASNEEETDSLNCWPQTKKRKRVSSQNTEVEVLLDIKDAITNFTTKNTQNANEWEIFSKFVCSEIQSMKIERNKRILKREIIQCILKHQMLEEEEINE